MSLNKISNQAIALAGIAQSCLLVQQLATTGSINQQALKTCIRSILKIDADSVIDVYGSLNDIQPGLEQLAKQIEGRRIDNPEQARYAASVVLLEKQLTGRPEMIHQITIGIEKAKAQSEAFGLMHDNIIANLGDLYHNTISTLEPRILVNGDEQYLSQVEIVNKIRTLLLSGIRSAWLWQQCGGTRWKFLFFRKKLQDEVHRLLSQIDS